MCGGWVGEQLSNIDPGPAIGGGLADVDKFVGNEIPGGWTTVAAAAAMGTGLYFAPEIMAALGSEGVAAADAAFMAEDAAALASQGLSQEAIAQNLALNYGISDAAAATAAGAASAGEFTSLTPEMINFANASGDPIAAISEISGMTPEQFSIYAGANGPELGLGEALDANGNIVQTFDDGSTIVRNGTEVISTTEAPGDPFEIPGVVKSAGTNLARQAANKLLSSATNKLSKGVGVKSGLNTLGTGADQNITASTSADFSNLTPDLVKGNPNFTLNDFATTAPNAAQTYSIPTNPAANMSPVSAPLSSVPTQSFSGGGDVEGGETEPHNPTFFSPGGLASMENTYVKGEGDGTSDSVAAMLANGEFVIPADIVAKLGNGSNDAGANVLDEFLSIVRKHAQEHDPKELPPDSKGPLAYLAEAKKKAQA